MRNFFIFGHLFPLNWTYNNNTNMMKSQLKCNSKYIKIILLTLITASEEINLDLSIFMMQLIGMYKLNENAPYLKKILYNIWRIFIPIAYILYIIQCMIDIYLRGREDIRKVSFNLLSLGEFCLIINSSCYFDEAENHYLLALITYRRDSF